MIREVAAHRLVAEPAPLLGQLKVTQAVRRVSRRPATVRIRLPPLRHFPLRKHALRPGWALKFPSIRKGFQIRVAGAASEYSAKTRSPGPILSIAGDLSDFPARWK